MSNFEMKTYKDSYLYRVKLNNREAGDPEKRNNQAILDFIVKSHRIPKTSDQFRGIVEDVKRQQTSSVLYNVLMQENVNICINQYEMPRAFKVFDAKDPKNDRKPAVFIDVTGIVELKGGYYTCKKVDVLCAYLFDALIYLLYRNYPYRLVDNSAVLNVALECYVAMFHNNIEYMGIPGYSANRKKVAYMSGLFFLTNMCGKQLDSYTKNLSGKLAGLKANEISAYDLYLNNINFENICTFITSMVDQFKFKGLTLEVFVSKWMYYYGTGTHYATELLTSFLCLIVNAYTGCYIVGQRQVERSCDAAMVKLANAILKAGVDSYNTSKAFMSESELKALEVHDKNTRALAESIKLANEVEDRLVVVESIEFSSIDLVKDKISKIKDLCESARINHKLDKYGYNSINNGIKQLYESSLSVLAGNDSTYENGSLVECAKQFKTSLDEKQSYSLNKTIDRDISILREACADIDAAKEDKKIVSNNILELMQLKQYI